MSERVQGCPESEGASTGRIRCIRHNVLSSTSAPSPDLLYAVLGTADLSAPAPYIRSSTPHFQYACYVAGGFSHIETCTLLGIKPETARKWRQRLQRVGAAFWGRHVSYELAARYAVDRVFRAEVLRFQQENAARVSSNTDNKGPE